MHPCLFRACACLRQAGTEHACRGPSRQGIYIWLVGTVCVCRMKSSKPIRLYGCTTFDLASYTVLLLQYSCTSASPPECFARYYYICALVPWESSPIRFSSAGHQSAVARSVASGNSGNRNVVFGISAFHPEVWERRYHGRCLQPLV
jgi:hypothetical protein